MPKYTVTIRRTVLMDVDLTVEAVDPLEAGSIALGLAEEMDDDDFDLPNGKDDVYRCVRNKD